MKRVRLYRGLQQLPPPIMIRWLSSGFMLDRRLVTLTEDLYETIQLMTQEYADKSVEISELLDQRLMSRGLSMPEEAIEELARYYISGEV